MADASVRFRLNHVRVPFRRPYVTAAGAADVREVLIVRLENDSGVIGLGEASLLPHETAGFEQLVRVTELAVRLFLSSGLDGLLKAQLGGSQIAAVAAVETAVRDAMARAEDKPLARALSNDALDHVEVNGLVNAADIDDAIEAAQELVAAGYGTVKLKVGIGHTAESEVVRIRAVREALTWETGLRLDANGAWDEATAMTVLGGISDLDIEYIEQPVVRQLKTMRILREGSNVPVAADEDVGDRASAKRVIEAQAADVLVLKPIPLGGITSTLAIAEESRNAGLSDVVTTSIDTGIGTAMALHIAAAIASSYAAGLATAHLLESDLLTTPLQITHGRMALPSRTGLGVELNEAAVRQYTVREWVVDR
ncbi:MAG: mandelate racemase/muconate lactonizing enzyme family protein [Dehalococcoidia bacterium]